MPSIKAVLCKRPSRITRAAFVACSLAACTSSKSGPSGGTEHDGSTPPVNSQGGDAAPGKPPVTVTVAPTPEGGSPSTDATVDLPVTQAPALPGTVKYTPNGSSVILYLPPVPGAKDYRVFAVEKGVTVKMLSQSREHIDGATLHCAGLRQRNQCDTDEILPIKYNNEQFDLPPCNVPADGRRPSVPNVLMQTLEVDGIGPDTTLVVEAIDRQCPFPGLFGSAHRDVIIVGLESKEDIVPATVNGKAYNLKRWPDTYPVFTEDEIRAKYGSMILNGQGPNQPVLDPNSPAFPESPYIRVGLPAPPDDPVVLARSVIKVSTKASALPDGFKATDYFDGFDDPTDTPKFVRDTDYTGTFMGVPVKLSETKKWIFYDVGTYQEAGRGFGDLFLDRGQINMLMGDPSQGSMSLQAMYPRRPVKLPDAAGEYLHVTYEAQRMETARRYENLVLCGDDKAGQTYDGPYLKAAPLPRPGFMNPDGIRRTTPLGWNCLYLVPRGSGYWRLPGGDVDSHPDTSLKASVLRTQPVPATGAIYDSEGLTSYATDFGPTQDVYGKQWERTIDDSGKMAGMWLDDHMNAWQKTKFDVFIRRDRFVIYVDGEQRVCGDMKASPLTMAEGALGFWHVLYHSSAEFTELRTGTDPNTGQHHIMHNEPFADQRSWDNVGFQENVALPAGFDSARCN